MIYSRDRMLETVLMYNVCEKRFEALKNRKYSKQFHIIYMYSSSPPGYNRANENLFIYLLFVSVEKK